MAGCETRREFLHSVIRAPPGSRRADSGLIAASQWTAVVVRLLRRNDALLRGDWDRGVRHEVVPTLDE